MPALSERIVARAPMEGTPALAVREAINLTSEVAKP